MTPVALTDPRLKTVSRVRSVMMPCVLLAGASLFLLPFSDARQTLIRIHYSALGLLFLFLNLGELCHLRILWLTARGAEPSRVQTPAFHWRVLTELVPGAAALLILASGLRLVREVGYTLEAPWLFLLVAGFGLLFADGILGYTEDVRELQHLASQAARGGSESEVGQFVREVKFWGLLLSHYVSMPLLYLVGRFKPGEPAWISAWLVPIDQAMGPLAGRMTGVFTALLVIGLEFPAVFFVRHRRKRDKI